MAECNGGCAGCEHCGRAEPDPYGAGDLPDVPPITPWKVDVSSSGSLVPAPPSRPRYNIRGAIVGYDVTTTAPDDLPTSGCLVRDLADAIRAIALARGTESPIDVVIQSALVIARRADAHYPCDGCGQEKPAECPGCDECADGDEEHGT